MKIAVTAQGKELSSRVDLRFGRAKCIILYDTETRNFEVHDNAVNLTLPQGAGIQTASNIAELGGEAVITGNVGPNAFKTLSAAAVQVFLAGDATVQDAIEQLGEGELERVDQANVEGHWI